MWKRKSLRGGEYMKSIISLVAILLFGLFIVRPTFAIPAIPDLPIECEGMNFKNTIIGTDGDDVINAGSGSQLIWAFNGNDTIDGGSGDDCIVGGIGEDTIHGGSGNDRLYGQTEKDIVYGDSGDDQIFGQGHADMLFGGSGNDKINGSTGVDIADGDSGKDLCSAEVTVSCELPLPTPTGEL